MRRTHFEMNRRLANLTFALGIVRLTIRLLKEAGAEKLVFYETKGNQHGLPHDPFKSCVVPRCIGWISTLDAAGGINIAPYSFFNGVCDNPPMVMFASGGKHTHGQPKRQLD